MSKPPDFLSTHTSLSSLTSAIETDLASPFSLSRVSISLHQLPPNSESNDRKRTRFIIPPLCKYFAFVVRGSGDIVVGDEDDEIATSIGELGAFGWGVDEVHRCYSVDAGKDGMSLLIFSDKYDGEKARFVHPARAPATANARTMGRPGGFKGTKYAKIALLTRSLAPSYVCAKSPLYGDWNVNLEILPPGTKSSDAHCHSLEDEFAYMLRGQSRYWNHGKENQMVLKEGDCVGWKAGTGLAHTLINDGLGPNFEGEDFIYLIFGEEKPDDKLFYPDRPLEQCRERKRWLVNRPEVPWGTAEKEPKYPRPDDYEG